MANHVQFDLLASQMRWQFGVIGTVVIKIDYPNAYLIYPIIDDASLPLIDYSNDNSVSDA